MNDKKKYFTILILVLYIILIFFTAHAVEEPSTKSYDDILRVGVVGDTGIGERAYHAGFTATAKALKENHPDLLLHLGDFAYQTKIFPQTCPERYLRKIKETLADPFKFKLFVPGDNDLPPNTKKPKGSGCWGKINQVDSNFDSYPVSSHKPRVYEGTMTVGNTFFAILNTYPWEDPTLWLAPRIKKAKNKGLWIIIALHEPAITTAWYLEKRDSVLRQLNLLQPDLVFSGNQHSYERFHQIGIPEPNGVIPFVTPESENYLKGNGTIHVVSGGGGAFLRPFADQQGFKKRTAPKEVFNALATRAIMNHFLILEITKTTLAATTYRVCPKTTVEDKQNPRWKPDKPIWESVKLECNGKNKGSTVFEHFKIRENNLHTQ